MKVCNEFLVGADPEFVVRAKGDALGDIERTLGANIGYHVPLGFDHGGSVAECRPTANLSTFKVVQNLREILLAKMPKRYELLHNLGKWEAGGFKTFTAGARVAVQLGGHVHFGVELRTPQTRVMGIKGIKIREALDKLTTGLEKLDILNTSESHERRRAGFYGQFGDIRYAGEAHFEYRSMCSWLYHPETAMVAMTLAKLGVKFPLSMLERLEKPLTIKEIERLIERGASKHSDDDCRIVKERILGHSLQHDPGEDFRGFWEDFRFGKGVEL